MKTPFATLSILILSGALAAAAPDMPYTVQFECGDSFFEPGDNITIQQMHGTSGTIAVGGTYSVDGTYALASHDKADICFFTTCISNNGATPVDPAQTMHVKKGSGSFHLVEKMADDGYFHVSFYDGGRFNGVYFGQGDRVYRGHAFSSAPHAGPNRILYQYLGNPVEPPPHLDARYSKEGLVNAIQQAARDANIAVKKIEIEDSEFPYLVGVICGGADFPKLKSQLKKLDGYNYGGGVGNDVNKDGSDSCNTFCIVPYHAFPRDASERIYHRLMLREEAFHTRLNESQ